MRRIEKHPIAERGGRRAEWKRYATHPSLGPEVFGMSFRTGKHYYKIDGWLQRNREYPIYVIRDDGETFAARIADLNDSLGHRFRSR